MLEGTDPRDRIIAAALRLAERRPWRELSLGEIAAEAGIPLLDFRREFKSKAHILGKFSKLVDAEVLKKFPAPAADAPRDRLFDLMLTRFEILQPYKPALRRISESAGLGAVLSQAKPALKSHYWMLAAAGINAEGWRGLLRIKGLVAIYLNVFSIWLEDDDPGMARTMAALDRRLRRGESILEGLDRICGGIAKVGRGIRHGCKRAEPETKAPEGPEPEPQAQQI